MEMQGYEFEQFERLWLKRQPTLSEKWVQERIAENPEMLGLGDVLLRDKERIQPKAGRLDLLLQDSDAERRYEVEIQLGATDESHIIRTIEYWDIERKRYPQFDHTAVIVAEDITSRFLNVISLFNGFIPLVAIQMSALRHGNVVSLMFTTVLDQMTLGLPDDEEVPEVADRAYWERQATPRTVGLVDRVLAMIHQFEEAVELKYNKHYIGLALHGQTNNFAAFRPRKSVLMIEFRMTRSQELESRIEQEGLDFLDFNRWGNYRIRLSADEIEQHKDFIIELLKRAYSEAVG
jgi:predicted transport protein